MYENASGVEQNHISYVDTESLEYVWAYGPSLEYGLIDDAILGFDFSEYKSNFENLTIKIIDEDNKQYVRISENWFAIQPAISENGYLYAEEFTIDSENVVNLKVLSGNSYGESYRALGYVNQVVLTKGGEIVKVLWSQDEPNHDIDESAWLVAIKNALMGGQDINSVFPLGEIEPITFDMDDIVLPATLAGNFNIRFTYKMYGATYTQDNPYEWDDDVVEYTIVKQLPQATININSELGKLFGTFEIVIPDQVENGSWNYYTLEVKDGEGNPIGTYSQDDYVGSLSSGYSIRIRLDVDPTIDYYTTGEWSDWYICDSAKISTPEWSSQSYDENGITVSWYGVDYAEKYVYVINDGEELETSETSVSGLKDGDTIKVKAVPTTGNYSESDYSVVYTATETRTQLAAPANVRVESNYLMWDAVANAAYYEIEITQN